MHKGRIVRTLPELRSFLSELDSSRPLAADVETYKQRPTQPNALLLGLALTGYSGTGEYVSAYVVFYHFDKLQKRFIQYFKDSGAVGEWLEKQKLIGWNVPFDESWLRHYVSATTWIVDGRIMWHLQNNDPLIRGFGLKLAQKKLLGWEESNDKELEENVKMSGGSLSKGDHYLADLDLLSHYACLDTYSTLLCYECLVPFMNKNNYMWFHDEMLTYAINLSQASSQGLPVSEVELIRAVTLYKQKKEQSALNIREVCKGEIQAIEEGWKTKTASTYKTDSGRNKYLQNPSRFRSFNPSSGVQRQLLLHTMLEYPIKERTPTGLAKTDRSNISLIPHESAKELINYSEYKKISEQAQTYLNYTEDGRLYTNYDVCGTVSGRLSGFRPSVLNMPFSEPEVMSAFKCDDGYVGIHADLAAIEPCVLAHYSEDPSLLKVYRNGFGDIYLDLALEIFNDREDLKNEYNSQIPIKSEIKEKFKDLRAVCKIIHLAVSYTGTYITVSKNLSKSGFPTSKGQAMLLVKRYWQKFQQVKTFDYKLQELYSNSGIIRNITGRIIQVPDIYKKDLMNRLVQSSAHDILRIWVNEIVNQFTLLGVDWKWWLPDLHDSTTFMIKEGQEELARQCYLKALQLVEERVNISVPLKCELKFCKTLAGVKGG